MKSRTVILIGGAPTTGKSTIAKSIARYFDLPWISSDQIRTMMRVTARREDYPTLFRPEGYDARRFFAKFPPKRIVEMEYGQGEAVWPGIKKFIRDDYTWKQGFVIEGMNVQPHLIHRDFKDDGSIRPVFLVDRDRGRTHHVIRSRGLWGREKYPDDIKVIETEYVLDLSKRFEREAKKYGYPCVEVSKEDDDVYNVIRALRLYESWTL